MSAEQQALDLIRTATSGDAIDRPAALAWRQLLQGATGQERERIGSMAEALLVEAITPDDRWWVETLLEIEDSIPAGQIGRQMDLAVAEKRSIAAVLATSKVG